SASPIPIPQAPPVITAVRYMKIFLSMEKLGKPISPPDNFRRFFQKKRDSSPNSAYQFCVRTDSDAQQSHCTIQDFSP
ncbi:MAG: hypothetical protein ACKON9_08280, partial [Planctomycetaceae bacterium]